MLKEYLPAHVWGILRITTDLTKWCQRMCPIHVNKLNVKLNFSKGGLKNKVKISVFLITAVNTNNIYISIDIKCLLHRLDVIGYKEKNIILRKVKSLHFIVFKQL